MNLKLVLVFNSWKRFRVNLVFPLYDVLFSFAFFIMNKLCFAMPHLNQLSFLLSRVLIPYQPLLTSQPLLSGNLHFPRVTA